MFYVEESIQPKQKQHFCGQMATIFIWLSSYYSYKTSNLRAVA